MEKQDVTKEAEARGVVNSHGHLGLLKPTKAGRNQRADTTIQHHHKSCPVSQRKQSCQGTFQGLCCQLHITDTLTNTLAHTFS